MFFPILLFLLLQIQLGQFASNPLVFLTFSSNGHRLNVSLVSDEPNGQFLLDYANQSQPMQLLYNISARNSSNGSLSGDALEQIAMSVYGAQMEVPSAAVNGTSTILEYSIVGQGSNGSAEHLASGIVDMESAAKNLTICVFGDYMADMMYARDINLSKYAAENHCGLILFIGKISWEQRECPKCNGTDQNDTAMVGNSRDIGLSFSPYSMLDDNMGPEQVSAFANVPSIFGQIGHNLNETSFFDCTEVDDIAFIQTTVELSTVANLDGHGSEQFKYVEQYFRETMLMELECKLQELHRRPKRPWILVYLTHPSLINEKQTDVLSLKDNDRFFDILNRYKIDLLLSCGVEGMALILKERQAHKPTEQLPPYLGTTMATCLNEKDCQYLVLDVGTEQLDWRYMDGGGTAKRQGQFQKSTQSADECVPDEIPSITGEISNS